MRVHYDGRIYRSQVAGGVNRYFANLIAGLPSSVTPILTASCRRPEQYPEHQNLELHLRGFSSWPRPLSSWQQRRYFRRCDQRLEADLLHPTYYRLLSGRPLGESGCPVVLTVFDMIHERFASWVDPAGRHASMKRRAIMDAQAVICISNNTKRELLERFRLPESRVSVIHLASELYSSAVSGSGTVPAGPFFLYVGSRARYKNFDTLLEAMRDVTERRPDCRLFVVGALMSRKERQQLVNLRLENRVVACGYVDDGQLVRLYQSSVALVYPSLCEGFGIPPLEAMECGTAVVAARSSSIPEVVGDAAMLFEPDSPEELAEAMVQVVDDPELRDNLIARGRRQAATFRWEKTVTETMSIYQSVLEN